MDAVGSGRLASPGNFQLHSLSGSHCCLFSGVEDQDILIKNPSYQTNQSSFGDILQKAKAIVVCLDGVAMANISHMRAEKENI